MGYYAIRNYIKHILHYIDKNLQERPLEVSGSLFFFTANEILQNVPYITIVTFRLIFHCLSSCHCKQVENSFE
jgi:hypothetical protein